MSGSQWEFYGGDDYLGGKKGGMSENIVCINASLGPHGIQAAKARTAAVQASNAATQHLGDFAIRITLGRRDIICP